MGLAYASTGVFRSFTPIYRELHSYSYSCGTGYQAEYPVTISNVGVVVRHSWQQGKMHLAVIIMNGYKKIGWCLCCFHYRKYGMVKREIPFVPRLSSGHMRLSVKCVPCRMSFIATSTLMAPCERAANPRTGARDPVSLLMDAVVVGHVHESLLQVFRQFFSHKWTVTCVKCTLSQRTHTHFKTKKVMDCRRAKAGKLRKIGKIAQSSSVHDSTL